MLCAACQVNQTSWVLCDHCALDQIHEALDGKELALNALGNVLRLVSMTGREFTGTDDGPGKQPKEMARG